MKKLFLILGFLFFATAAHGQTQISSLPFDPATCDPNVGAIYFNTTSLTYKVCVSTNTWGPFASGGTPNFNDIMSGTNTQAAMIVSTGASLSASGSGTIAATTAAATAGVPTDCGATNAATGIDSSFNATGCFVPAMPNASADAVRYVSPAGNDSNSGLDWGHAKLTGYNAAVNLPGGNGTNQVGGGRVIMAPSSVWCSSGGKNYGIMIMGSADPNFGSPPTCWAKSAGGSVAPLHIDGLTKQVFVDLTGIPNSTDDPGIWLSATVQYIYFSNLSFQYPARGVVVSECSNNDRTGLCAVVNWHFDNVNPQIGTSDATHGPDWDIAPGGYWGWIDNSSGQSDTSVASAPTADKAQAMLVTNSGLIYIRNFRIGGNSGIKINNTTSPNGMTIENVTLDGSLAGPSVCSPVVWVVSTGGAEYDLSTITNSDCATTSYAVEVDAYNYPTDVRADFVQGQGSNTKGPMIIGNQYSANIAFLADPLVNNQVGFYKSRVIGETDVARRAFVAQPVQYLNLAANPGSWTLQGAGVTVTTGVAGDPLGGSNTIRVAQSSGVQAGAQWFTSTRTFATGDWLVWAGWVKSPDGTFVGGNPMQAGFSAGSCTVSSTQFFNYPYVAPSLPATATNWQWVYGYAKVATGGACTFGVNLRTDTTHRADAFGVVGNVIPTGVDDQTALDYVSNLNSYVNTCLVGQLCGVLGVIGGNVNVNSANITNPNFNGATPAAPAGNQNVIYQASGSNVSSYVPLPITVNGGSGLPTANLQNGSANLGDTINMVQSLGNVSAQIATGSIRTPTGGGTGVSNPTAHGVAIAEGSSNFSFPVGSVDGQCFLWHAADPSFGSCPSGFANPMTTFGDIIFEGTLLSAQRLAGPTSPNGVPQTLISIPSGGVAAAPQWQLAGVPVNAQSGAGYTMGVTDRASLITVSNGSAQNLTFVNPATSGFGANYAFNSFNIGAGAWTDVCTTFLCNGAASLLLPPSWAQFVFSNNSTYTVERIPDFTAFPNTPTNNALAFNSTTGVFSALSIGPGSSTNGDLASFNGTTGLPIQDSGIAQANVTQNSVSGTTNAIPKFSAAHTITNSTLQDNGTNVVLTTEPLDLVTKPLLVEIANETITGTTVNKLAKLTGVPSSLIITMAGDTKFEGIVVGGAGTAGNAQIASVGSVVSCVFDGATTAGHYVQGSASVNGDCTDGGASRPTSGQVVGRVTSTNGGAGTYNVEVYGPDDIAVNPAGGGGGPTLKTNGSSNADQTALNLQNSAATNGITLTVTNTGTSNVQLGYTGTLNNSGLTNASTTVNGVSCTLGSTCTVPSSVGTIFTTSIRANPSLNTTQSAPLTGSSGFNNAASAYAVIPVACTAKNAYVVTGGAQPVSGSLVFTLRDETAGSDTTLVVTIAAGAAAGTFTDLTHTPTLTVGDQYDWKVVDSATSGTAAFVGSVGFQCN